MKRSRLILLFLLCIILPAFADVDLKTGDFHINYKDINYESLKGINIERTYNSSSRSTGLFGYGWTSPYETRLFIIGDGNILIREVGSGCKTCAENGSGNASILIREKGFFELFFTPAEPDQSKIDQATGKIIQMLIRDRKLENIPVEIAKKRKELLASMSQRAAEWITYTDKGWLDPLSNPTNAKWFSTNGELQNVTIKDNGFIRSYNDKSYEGFDIHGILQNKYDYKGKLVFEISYSANKISRITDGTGNIFNLQLNDKGLVTSIQTKKDRASYQYNEAGYLITSTDADKKTKKYTYNQGILVAIESDKDILTIVYDPRTYRVTHVKNEREGEVKENKEYHYKKILKDDGSLNPFRFATTVMSPDEDGNTDSIYNEYELKEILGRPYTYKTIVKEKAYTTETVFTECGCGPLSIKRGYKYANFQYDGRSRMIGKVNNDYILTASYEDEHNKITRVERKDKKSGEVEINEFFYSPFGDVVEARANDKVITLAYNEARLINKINSPEAVLFFKYNSFNKPIEISMEAGGTISVKYDEKGEIEKVESSEGQSMALKVTQAFQHLLSAVKPKGLDYKMN